jgi:23S rRNA (adenine2030-N6)-methyltransferase
MFSYRHGFHAGNHADVLKHAVLISVVRHLLLKDTPIMVVDTHAGAGLYRLDDSFAQTSGEAQGGVGRLYQSLQQTPPIQLTSLLSDYLTALAQFNVAPSHQVYPGSPLLVQKLLRGTDKLKLFELHPTDSQTLLNNVMQLRAGRQVAAFMQDGFAGVKKFVPPPSRRGLVLCDPSYEVKTDYAMVVSMLADALKRFATGTYFIWYPAIERREAHELPRQLKAVAQAAGKPWLHAQLMVKSASATEAKLGLPGSGVFIVNPPYTLEAALRPALAQLKTFLAQDIGAASHLEVG